MLGTADKSVSAEEVCLGLQMRKDTDLAQSGLQQRLGGLCDKQYWFRKHGENAGAQEGQAKAAAKQKTK